MSSTLADAVEEVSEARSSPTFFDGIVAGVAGAALIAVFFLALDLVAGRPLWTPTALGSAFFLGQTLPANGAVVPALVLGYSVMHGVGFVGIGLLGAYVLQAPERLPWTPAKLAVAAAIALFLAFQAFILTLAAIFEPQLMAELGTGKVAAANGLAAVAMSVMLVRAAR